MGDFEKKLAMGNKFEEIIDHQIFKFYPDCYCMPLRKQNTDYQGNNFAPSYTNAEGVKLITTDYNVRNHITGREIWVDAKFKNNTFFYDGGYEAITIDIKAYNDYKELQKHFRGEVNILAGIKTLNKIFQFNLADRFGWQAFNNKFSKNKDDSYPVYRLEDAIKVIEVDLSNIKN